jgi:DNA-binding NarL/FixJ family response regulator
MIRILIVDDDSIIREGLKMIMETQQDITVVGCGENGQQAVELCRRYKPDVALLDIRMPMMDGIEASQLIIKEKLAAPLLLTTFDEKDLILRALKSGVSGYILKNSPADRILGAIRVVASGGTVFQKDILDYITSQMKVSPKENIFTQLTERELEVTALVSRGLSNKEIGEALFISDGTVRNHISSILDKTSLEHRTQIAIAFLSQNS